MTIAAMEPVQSEPEPVQSEPGKQTKLYKYFLALMLDVPVIKIIITFNNTVKLGQAYSLVN